MTDKVSIAFADESGRTHPLSISPVGSLSPASRTPTSVRTTAVERALLFVAIILLPLETLIPPVAGLSSSFIAFGLLAGYLLVYHPQILLRTARHRLFLAVYALLAVGLLIETLHPFPRYQDLFRIALMVAGAILIAARCFRPTSATREAGRATIRLGLLDRGVEYLPANSQPAQVRSQDAYAHPLISLLRDCGTILCGRGAPGGLGSGRSRTAFRLHAHRLFDHISPEHNTRHSEAEVRGWFECNGFINVQRVADLGMRGDRPT